MVLHTLIRRRRDKPRSGQGKDEKVITKQYPQPDAYGSGCSGDLILLHSLFSQNGLVSRDGS